VGCIHTTQGYDLNYAGIIFGHEISYDKTRNEIVILKDKYRDINGRQTESPEQLKQYIINIYKTMMLRGIKGTYLYACDPDLREYLSKFVPQFHSKDLSGIVKLLSANEVKPFVDAIPVYYIDSTLDDIDGALDSETMPWVKTSNNYPLTKEHFALKVTDDSMDKILPKGSYAVFRKRSEGIKDGSIVLIKQIETLSSGLMPGYSIKSFKRKQYRDGKGWDYDVITLKPFSSNDDHKDIILNEKNQSSFKIIGVFERLLSSDS